MSAPLLVERDGFVATLTLNRPGAFIEEAGGAYLVRQPSALRA